MSESARRPATLDDFFAIPAGAEAAPVPPGGHFSLLDCGSARGRHETIRPQPFQAVEVFVGSLFGDDRPEKA
jgi:hypothetical protein